MGWESVAAFVGVACIFLFAAESIVLHVLPSGNTLLRNPISDFAAGGYRTLMMIGFLVLGVGVLLMDVALGYGLGAGKRVAVGIFGIGVFGLSRLLVAFFPSDVDGADRTAPGKLHTLFTAFGFIAIVFAAIVLTPVFDRVYEKVKWASVVGPLRYLELAVVVLGIVLLITRARALRSIFGLIERLFYISGLLWLFILGLHFALLTH